MVPPLPGISVGQSKAQCEGYSHSGGSSHAHQLGHGFGALFWEGFSPLGLLSEAQGSGPSTPSIGLRFACGSEYWREGGYTEGAEPPLAIVRADGCLGVGCEPEPGLCLLCLLESSGALLCLSLHLCEMGRTLSQPLPIPG